MTQNQSGAAERYYRNPTPESDSNKTPMLGDVPVTGNLFASGGTPAPSLAPAHTMRRAVRGYYDDNHRAVNLTELPEVTKELPKSSRGAMALNGENAFAGGTAVHNGWSINQGLVALPVTANSPSQDSTFQQRLQNISNPAAAGTPVEEDQIASDNSGEKSVSGLPPANVVMGSSRSKPQMPSR